MIETKFKDTEIGKIPREWEIIPLGNIGEPLMCKRIMKWQTNNSGGVPFYKIGTFGKKADAFIDANTFHYYKTHFNYPNKGDILISAAGTIGRTVAFDGAPAYFQDSNIVWIGNDQTKVLNAFLYYYYNIVKWNTEDGGIVTRLYNENLKSTPIAVPPLSEQRRIADALSKVDSLIESLDKLIAKKKAIKRGAMQELLTGKKRLPGFEGEWRKKKIKDLALTSSGGTPSRDIPSYFNGNIRWFTTSELNDKYLFDSIEHINEEALKHSSCKIFPKGSILLAMYGATIGKLGILTAPSATNQACCSILAQKASSMYLFYWLLFQRNLIVSKGRGAGQPNISQAIINDLEVHLPIDTSEQRAIAHVLSTMDAEIDALTRKRDKYKQVKQGMMQDLLTGRIRLVDK